MNQSMKKVILLVVVAIFSVTTLSAQNFDSESGAPVEKAKQEQVYGKNEIRVSYGALTLNQGLNLLIEMVTITLAQMDINLTGAINVEYMRYLTHWATIGVSASYEYGREAKQEEVKSRHHYLTLMPTTKLFWFNRPSFGMYSRLGVGASYAYGHIDGEDNSHWRPALQISGICMEAGGEKVRAYLELGWGTQGFALFGISTRF